MRTQLEEIIRQVYHKEKRNLFTFLTGAGVSSDSGIPTYRGTDGIWVKGTKFHKPEEFGTLKYFKQNPEEVLQFSLFRNHHRSKKLLRSNFDKILHIFQEFEIKIYLK